MNLDGLIQLRVNNPLTILLRNKTDDLRKVSKNVQIDILCIDETKLDDSFPVFNLKLTDISFFCLEEKETIEEQ